MPYSQRQTHEGVGKVAEKEWRTAPSITGSDIKGQAHFHTRIGEGAGCLILEQDPTGKEKKKCEPTHSRFISCDAQSRLG